MDPVDEERLRQRVRAAQETLAAAPPKAEEPAPTPLVVVRVLRELVRCVEDGTMDRDLAAKGGGEVVPTSMSPPGERPARSCDRHEDCDEADADALFRGRPKPLHLHDWPPPRKDEP